MWQLSAKLESDFDVFRKRTLSVMEGIMIMPSQFLMFQPDLVSDIACPGFQIFPTRITGLPGLSPLGLRGRESAWSESNCS